MSKKWLWLTIGVVTASLVLLSGCGKSQAPKQHWFEGGTLHESTAAQWKMATPENKLATAADWLAATKWEGHLNSPSDFDRFKVKSQKLVNGVDKAILGVEEVDSLRIKEIAASIIVLSNDLGP